MDFPAVAERLARDLVVDGADLRTDFEVAAISHHQGGPTFVRRIMGFRPGSW